jgi:hypothetical protein
LLSCLLFFFFELYLFSLVLLHYHLIKILDLLFEPMDFDSKTHQVFVNLKSSSIFLLSF